MSPFRCRHLHPAGWRCDRPRHHRGDHVSYQLEADVIWRKS